MTNTRQAKKNVSVRPSRVLSSCELWNDLWAIPRCCTSPRAYKAARNWNPNEHWPYIRDNVSESHFSEPLKHKKIPLIANSSTRFSKDGGKQQLPVLFDPLGKRQRCPASSRLYPPARMLVCRALVCSVKCFSTPDCGHLSTEVRYDFLEVWFDKI